MAPGMAQVPSAPFSELLAQRWALYERQYNQRRTGNHAALGLSSAARLADECGWGSGEAGVRKLYRFRRGLRNGRRNGKSCEFPYPTFPRETVEEALHELGVDFTELYRGYAERLEGTRGAARDVLWFITAFEVVAEELASPVVVREAWCLCCAEVTLRDAEGECQWCAGKREFKARLAEKARQKRQYDQERARKRRALLEPAA